MNAGELYAEEKLASGCELERERALELADVCHRCRTVVAFAARGDSGVRDRDGVWCAICYAKQHKGWPLGPWSRRELFALYVLYVRGGATIAELVDQLWRKKGYRKKSGAVGSVQHAWKRNGWPMRRRGQSKRLRRQRTGPTLSPRRKLSEVEARALHPLHWEGWQSVNSIARDNHERLGLTQSALCSQLCYTWQLLGLPRHGRIEMTVRVSTKHGMKRRKGNSAAYKRFRAQQAGEQYDAPCTALNRRGRPCASRAMLGRDVCQFHAPERRQPLREQMAAMRARSPLHDPDRLEPAAPLAQLLRDYRAAGGTWRDLERLTGVPDHWLGHVSRGLQDRVDTGRAERVRAVLLVEEALAA
ncbi:MAG: hypothetical protein ACJ76I_12045 [Gaiellaceae bacterium]